MGICVKRVKKSKSDYDIGLVSKEWWDTYWHKDLGTQSINQGHVGKEKKRSLHGNNIVEYVAMSGQ